MSIVTDGMRDLIREYKKWLSRNIKDELKKENQYSYYIDKVLFALGKGIKMWIDWFAHAHINPPTHPFQIIVRQHVRSMIHQLSVILSQER